MSNAFGEPFKAGTDKLLGNLGSIGHWDLDLHGFSEAELDKTRSWPV